MKARRRSWRTLIMGRKGAVATNHPLATGVGLSVLRAGGNAADAAAAVSLALGVVEPHMSGLGGDAFLHLRLDAPRSHVVFNGSGAAPLAATPDRFHEGIPTMGGRSISTPGGLGAVFEMHSRYGVLPWARICAPAIELAEEGFAVTHTLIRYATSALARIRVDANSIAIFLRDGAIPELGTIIRQPALARTLAVISAQGAEDFYRGALAKDVLQDATEAGSFLQAGDLETYRAEIQEPLRIRYRGYEVLQTPPNSIGFSLLQALKIIEHFDLPSLGAGSAELLHILVEAKKRVYLDLERYATDPRTREVPVEHLLSDAYTAELAASISPVRTAAIPLQFTHASECNTTYFCIVDAAGNAVSALQSLNNPFGCGVTGPRTGILFNNRMATWHLEPPHPNALQPGKRVRQSMNAPMILRDGTLWAVFGTPGADNQLQVNLQTAVGLIDFELDPQAAAEAPRWTSSQPGQEANWPHLGTELLTLEEGFPAATLDGLRARGHQLRIIPALEGPCSLECIRVMDNGVRMAGSDPRCDGWAAAY
jgi:gamma-glutamyltranspeptidase